MNRIPRPQGSTYLSHQQQEHPSEENKNLLLKLLVTHYTINGFRYMGQSMSLDRFSNYIKIPLSDLMYHVSNIGTNMGQLVDQGNLQNTLKTIVTLATTNAIQDRGLIQSQVELLLRSQGTTYRPFISAEVTKAMKTLLDSNKNITDLYKTFFTDQSSTTNILIQGNQEQDNQDFVSTDQALSIIGKEHSLPPKASPRELPGFELDEHTSDMEIQERQHNLSELSGMGKALYDEYGVGDFESVLESRTGSEALLPSQPKGQGVTGPSGTDNEGVKDLKPSSHEDSFERRGIEVEDVDEVPNRE